MSRAVLLVNLGTPRSPSAADVRRYLAAVRKRLPTGMRLQVLPPFYGHEN